jgi:hypothetical protein
MSNPEQINRITNREVAFNMGLFLMSLLINAHLVLELDTMPDSLFKVEAYAEGMICLGAIANSLVRLAGDVTKIIDQRNPWPVEKGLYKIAVQNAIIRLVPVFPLVLQFLGPSITSQSLPFETPIPEPTGIPDGSILG